MIRLSDHFSLRRLLRYALPSIAMMIFSSIYGIVDGFFVSNYVGKMAFTAVNLIYPFLIILGSIGFMFGTGGAALISKTMGEKNIKKAKETFSLIIFTSVVLGIILSILGIIFLPQIASLLGAKDEVLTDCILYGKIILISLPFYILQYEFQCLFSTAGKPKFGLIVTVISGMSNIIFDYLLVVVFSLGLFGAAIATMISQVVGGVIPLIYFFGKNKSLLHFVKFKFDIKSLLKVCSNGSSEFLSNVSSSLISILYNLQLLKYAGENGVAAYGVLMYVSMIFQAIFIGYSIGVSPIVGYHYGAKNTSELKNVFTKSMIVIFITAIIMFICGELLSEPISRIFVSYDDELLQITKNAFRIFSFSFLLSGMSIYGSSFFTSLNNGLISALISFLRTVVFQASAVMILPIFLKLNGIWLSIVVAELMSFIITFTFLIMKRKKYQYI